jgi:SAM-dependent methyltransferase
MGHYRVGEFAAPAGEVSRLAAQAALIAEQERATLASLGLPATGRGIEVGCGPAFFAEGLARALPGIDLWGIDVDPYVVLEASKRLQVVRGDANALPFGAGRFAFAYCRLFLRHVSDPAAVLAGICHIVEPDGVVAAIDVSDTSLLLDPLPADFAAIASARHDWFTRRGGNFDMGHQLPGLFVRAGLKDVRVGTIAVTTTQSGTRAFADIVLTPFLQAAAAVLDDDARVAAASSAVDRWCADPAAFGIVTLFVVSGRRPVVIDR